MRVRTHSHTHMQLSRTRIDTHTHTQDTMPSLFVSLSRTLRGEFIESVARCYEEDRASTVHPPECSIAPADVQLLRWAGVPYGWKWFHTRFLQYLLGGTHAAAWGEPGTWDGVQCHALTHLLHTSGRGNALGARLVGVRAAR
jgi:hypothetical protein